MKKTRWPLLAAGMALVTIVTLWAPARHLGSAGPGPGAAEGAALQAAWEVRAFPAPTAGGITAADKAAFRRERTAVVDRIQRLYEALFTEPAALDEVAKTTLSRSASKALTSSRVGLHDKVSSVQTTKRRVKVGIQVDDGLRAAAVVLVEASATRQARRIRVWHRAHLWMEKREGEWKVIAFDAEQGRLR